MKTLLKFLFCLGLLCIFTQVKALENQKQSEPELYNLLKRLEKKISKIKSIKTDFVQEKKLAVFNDKLIIKGTIYLEKPNLLAWHVKEPLRYSIIINNEMIQQWDQETNQVQKVSIANNPAFHSIFEQLKKWFSGDYTSMLKEYHIKIIDQSPIILQFIPLKTFGAHNLVENVTVIFKTDEQYIRQINIKEKCGDSTLLTFINTCLNCPVDSSVWKVKQHVR